MTFSIFDEDDVKRVTRRTVDDRMKVYFAQVSSRPNRLHLEPSSLAPGSRRPVTMATRASKHRARRRAIQGLGLGLAALALCALLSSPASSGVDDHDDRVDLASRRVVAADPLARARDAGERRV